MYDVVIVGCGVSGAAVAYELSKYNLKLAIIEKENDVATGATKANSAIIHAGFDPEPGTLMSRFNVRGAQLAESICKRLDVPYDKCGALVLGFTEEDMEALEELKARGDAAGVEGLEVLRSNEAVTRLEPQISKDVVGALWAPTSAIVSPWEFCLAMAETAVVNGAEIFLETEVLGIDASAGGFLIKTNNGEFKAAHVVNAAGINSAEVHEMAAPHEFDIYPSRGQYFLMDKEEGEKVSHTIFQRPSPLGKGVLVSPTVHGNMIVGPDAENVVGDDKSTTSGGLNYIRDVALKSIPTINFANSIRNFAGVRARSSESDFIVRPAKGEARFIDVAGICSPGLSAAPAIAEYVAELLKDVGLKTTLKSRFINARKRVRFRTLSIDEKRVIINKNPAYGHVVCRCEAVTEGEILDSFKTPIPPRSVDGVKRRVNAGMGRCQGGFCGPAVVNLLAEHFGATEDKIVQEGAQSFMLAGKIGGGHE